MVDGGWGMGDGSEHVGFHSSAWCAKPSGNPTSAHPQPNLQIYKVHHASTQIEPYAGEFERRRPAFQRGGWGSEPPDPGSASARKIETH